MSTTALLTLLGLAAGAWFLACVRTPPPLVAGARRPDEDRIPPSVSIIVPARDEAGRLPVLLASLRQLELAPLEVIVVDDGSTDATAALAAEAGAVVIAAPPRPAGWVGKPWACETGALHAAGDVLVFLDADTRLAADGLGRLLDAHERLAPDGLLSVQPYHRPGSAVEQLSAFPNVVSAMASGAFDPLPGRDRPMAFGPCVITRAAIYHEVGGHAAVAGQVIEDLHLARRYRAVGRPVRCLAGGTAIELRMYPGGLGQLVEGWTKNLAGGARLAPVVPTLASIAWITSCVTVAADGIEAAVAGALGSPTSWWPLAAWLLVALELRWMLRRLGSFPWWVALAFPVPLAAFVALFARSLVLRTVRGRVRWKGRDLDVVATGG